MDTWRPDWARIAEQLPGSCCVLTTSHDGVNAGCLVASVMTLGVADPLLVIGLAAGSMTCRTLSSGRLLALHLLGERDVAIASRFAAPHKRGSTKFDNLPWHYGRGGAPILDHCVGVVLASVIHQALAREYCVYVAEPNRKAWPTRRQP